jgi:site-specific recombinase XerD
MKLAKIEKSISFHCARHTLATIALELSGDIASVSKLLGHSKISTTQIYAKVLESSKRNVIGLMDAI